MNGTSVTGNDKQVKKSAFQFQTMRKKIFMVDEFTITNYH